MGQGDWVEGSFPAQRGSKDTGQKPRKKRNSGGDGHSGKGRTKGHHLDSSMKMNPRGMKNENASQSANASTGVANIIRKKVEPETAKYFLEISNLFDNKEIDLEDRSTICANALEETKGKELELVTDGVISRTLQILVEGCELEQLCMFLRNCIQSFPVIAMDKFGSHVAEAAIRSLATHLEDETSRVIVEEILNKICKAIAADSTNVMCSCYGSHVLRTLLCLCKGVPLDSLKDFHTTKRSAVLAERLSCGSSRSGDQNPTNCEHGFSDMFKTFVRQMLQNAKNGISALLTEKNSSLVLQTVLKLSAGDDHELNHIISILLGYDEDAAAQKEDTNEQKNKIVALLEDTAYSHLLEQYIRQYVASLLALDDDQILQIAKDSGGSRVLEAFLCSTATAKRKFKVFAKLLGHYGEIAMNPSGSFLVEKCFAASNFSHKEAIVSELLAMQHELSKTRHAIYLLKKLDVDRYSRRPEQWRAAQTSKETTQREFQAEFGLNSKPTGQSIEELLSQSPTKKRKQKEKNDKITVDASTNKPDLFHKNAKRQKSAEAMFEGESSSKKLASETTSTAFLNNSGKKKSPGFLSDKPSSKKQKHQRPNSGQSDGRRFVRDSDNTPFVRKNVKQKQSIAELAALAGKDKLTAGEVRKLLKPEISAKN